MIIYNVTVNVNHDVHDEWLQWMKEVHVPDVLKTGLFMDAKMLRLLGDEDSGGVTFAIQYTCENIGKYHEYRDKHSQALQQDALKKFPGKFVAFRTLLETV